MSEGCWELVLGRAISRALMQGVWREDLRMRKKRQVDPREAEHYPSEVLKVMRDMSKVQGSREDDRRPILRGDRKTMLAGGEKLDGITARQ